MDTDDPQSDRPTQRRQLLALVGRVERRTRLQRVLDRATSTTLVYAMGMAVAVVLFKTGWITAAGLTEAALVGLALPLAGMAWGWFAPVDRIDIAQKIDRSNGLHDRISTALSLLEDGDDQPFHRAQIRDALRHHDRVDPAQAAPFGRPTDLGALAVFLAAVGALAILEPPATTHPLPSPPVIEHDPVLDETTVAVERERLEQMKRQLAEVDDADTEQLIDDIDELLDDVEKRKISDKEFLERIDDIERRFFDKQKENTAQTLADKLQKAAQELKREADNKLGDHKQLADAIDALDKKDLDAASKAMDKLAKKLNNDELSDEDAKELADLLEKFADKVDIDDPALKKLAEQHQELVEKLAKQFNADGNLSTGEKKRLDREKKKLADIKQRQKSNAASPSSRQLKRIQRASKDMANKLKNKRQSSKRSDKQQGDKQARNTGQGQKQGQQQGQKQGQKNGQQQAQNAGQGQKQGQQQRQQSSQQQAGETAQKAAKQLRRSGDQQKADQVRRMARKQLEEMKESMRRSNSQPNQKGGQGESQRAQKMRDFLDRANGQKPGGKSPKSGKSGNNKADSNKAGSNKSSKRQAKNGKKPGKGAPGQSNQAGKGKGKRGLGEATQMTSQRKDSRVDGHQNANGPSKSQIIKAASEKGFATTDYKDVYVDYESVAEEVMDREKVPAGYRYYVKRYFELIKPRKK